MHGHQKLIVFLKSSHWSMYPWQFGQNLVIASVLRVQTMFFSKSFIWPWYNSTLGQGHQDLIISLKPSQWCICVSLVKIWPLVEDIKSKFFYGCMTLVMTLVTLKIGKDHLTEIRSTAPANVWTFMVIKKFLKSKHLPGGTFSKEFMYQCSRAGASLNLKVRNRAKMRTNHPVVWYITFI